MNNYVKINGLKDFSIQQIFDCGQCFRFDSDDDGCISGIAYGKKISLKQIGDTLYIYNINEDEYESTWKHYLALDVDYSQIKQEIIQRFDNDTTISSAIEYGHGIRILRQEPWEIICSFIISQNNNIPRIKKIISRMVENYGIAIDGGYTFPTAEVLYNAGIDKLTELKMGFRAKYIYDAAERIVTGKLNIDEIKQLDTVTAMNKLQEVKGIGPKVASCILLFGFDKTDVFPIDVWIKRVLEKYYPNGLDISKLGKYAGIAQQYLFYFERYTNI